MNIQVYSKQHFLNLDKILINNGAIIGVSSAVEEQKEITNFMLPARFLGLAFNCADYSFKNPLEKWFIANSIAQKLPIKALTTIHPKYFDGLVAQEILKFVIKHKHLNNFIIYSDTQNLMASVTIARFLVDFFAQEEGWRSNCELGVHNRCIYDLLKQTLCKYSDSHFSYVPKVRA